MREERQVITHWDANELNHNTAEEAGSDGTVHSQAYTDGRPLCWDEPKHEAFSGSFKAEEVTCKSCLTYLGD